jgi:HEAT repeat protein
MLWLTQHQLKSKNVETRRKALEELGRSPPPRALPALRAALDDEDAEVRRLAAAALGRMDDERKLDSLLVALNDRNAEVVKAAIVGLKNTTGERVLTALAPLIHHSDAGVRGQAALNLEAQGWHPSRREEEIWLLVAKGKFGRAAAYGSEAIPALEAVVLSGPYSLCMGAVQALADIDDPRVMRPLLNALRSDDAAVCVAAVDALARMGGSKVIEPITNMLHHRNGQVRLAAVEAFANLGKAAPAEPLRGLLADPVWDVRRMAAEILGRLRDPGAVESLTKALTDSDADVREASAMALGNLGDRRAIGPLVMTLKDSASGVRRIAAAALARIDEDWSISTEAQAAVEKLRPALNDSDPDVRYFVGQLLHDLGATKPESAPAAAAPASPSPARFAAEPDDVSWSSLEKRRKLAVSLFLAILCDADRDLRLAAAESLGRIGDRRAESALVRALQDEDEGVRTAVQQALHELHGD